MRFFVCILVLLFVHNQFSRADKTLTDDSLYTEKYIRDIYIPEPRRALQLLDEAENRKTMLSCWTSWTPTAPRTSR